MTEVPPARARAEGPGPFRSIVVFLALVVFPLLVVVAFLASLVVLPRLANLPSPAIPSPPENLTRLPGIGNATRPSAVASPPIDLSLPFLPGVSLVDVLAGLAALLLVYLVAGALRNRVRELSLTGLDVLAEEKRRHVAEVLDETVARLAVGSDYRETVLRCYKLISEILEAESKIDGRTLTAREFRRSVSAKLRLDSPYLSQATDLFEVARYSEGETTRAQAMEASECLSNLSASLRRAPAQPPPGLGGTGTGHA